MWKKRDFQKYVMFKSSVPGVNTYDGKCYDVVQTFKYIHAWWKFMTLQLWYDGKNILWYTIEHKYILWYMIF